MRPFRHVLRTVSVLIPTLVLLVSIQAGPAAAFTQQAFRRLSTSAGFSGTACVGSPAGLGGAYSFWAGLLPAEATSNSWTGTQGYGNDWYVAIGKSFTYNGSGTVQLDFDYNADLQPGKDFARALIDTTGGSDCGVEVGSYTGSLSGSASFTLTPGLDMRSNAGIYTIYFLVTSDEAGSDEDGGYSSSCGGFAVDDVSVVGGGTNTTADFETGPDGWALAPCPPDCSVQYVYFDCSGGVLSALQDPINVSPGDYLAWNPAGVSACATPCGGSAATFEITFPADANLFPSGYSTGKVNIGDATCPVAIPTGAVAGSYKYDIIVYDNNGTVCPALSPNPLDPHVVVSGGPAVPGLRTRAILLLVLIMMGGAAWALRRRAAKA